MPAAVPIPGSVPGAREPSQTLRFPSRDGVGLYGEFFDVASPVASAVILHGYAEHCGRYREVANVLAGEGIASLSFDQRGHGRAEGQRGHIQRWSNTLDDLDAAVERLDHLCPGDRPRFLVCHSNGSLIALRALADPSRIPSRVVGAVLSSPFLRLRQKVNPVKTAVAQIAGRLLPTLSMPNELRIEDLTHDPGKLAERRIDTLCHEVASSRWFTEMLEAQEWVREFIVKMKVPTLWLVAGGDRIADPATTRQVHARVRAPSIYREFPEMHHEVFNEVGRGTAFDLIREFVRERLRG